MDKAHQQINYYDGSQQHPEPSHSNDGQRQRQATHTSPTHPSVNHGLVVDGGHSGRAHLQSIALTTIEAINNGLVDVSKAMRRTRFYSPRSPELANWRELPTTTSWYKSRPSNILIAPMTTIEGTKYLHNSHPTRRLAVLNFASATRPGGGFLEGAMLALVAVSVRLGSCKAQGNSVDAGRIPPGAVVFMLTTLPCTQLAPVAAPIVLCGPRPKRNREGARNLVLGSFGTGVFRNDIEAMAVIWCDLLLGPSARFASSFENIVFAIPDRHTRRCFESIFCRAQGRN
ncbi:hypothetical protein CPC08DRAFT_702594 [Agrocybe pediades]|nr:hypothetical protein CPC08DRAFT_702594 [Agrocybe pediades]